MNSIPMFKNPRLIFKKVATGLIACFMLFAGFVFAGKKPKTQLNAHLWVYASKYPPEWNCNADIEQVFADLSYAGYDGVELMHVNLRDDTIVPKIQQLIQQYHLPVSGTSFSGAFWDKSKHAAVLADAEKVLANLQKVGGKTFGISVGDAGRIKTEAELDAQAELLKEVMLLCGKYGAVPNLHNHTYEVVNDMHDLKGTMIRVPDIKLGPDLNWLIRGGIDPVWFINTYASKIIYLHIRDQDTGGEWTETLGTGATDFKKIAMALERNNFAGAAAVELAFPKNFKPTMPLRDNWKKSRTFVLKTFKWKS